MRAAHILRPPTVIGEDLMTSSKPRHAAICLTHAMTLSISVDSFAKAVREHPGVASIMRKNVLRDNVRVAV